MTDSATFTTPEAGDEDLGDLLLEVLPPDGSTIGNLSAREALGRAAERQISEEEYEAVKEKPQSYNLGMDNAKEECANKRVHTENPRNKNRTCTGRDLAWKNASRELARYGPIQWEEHQSQQQQAV